MTTLSILNLIVRKSILFLLILFACVLSQVQAQTNVPINKLKSFGLLLSWPIVKEILPEGPGYAPKLIQGNLRVPLLNNETQHQVTILVQPQFNPVGNLPGQSQFTWEAGVNFGIAYEYLISEQVGILYAGAGIGPHFINVETNQQADGFIFSDNLFVGMHQFVGNRSWFLTYELKLRHISNAGLQNPNASIGNVFLGFGVSYFLF
jgi:hypothetical protein